MNSQPNNGKILIVEESQTKNTLYIGNRNTLLRVLTLKQHNRNFFTEAMFSGLGKKP